MPRHLLPKIMLVALLGSVATVTAAHEVWMEPDAWVTSPDQPLRAKLVNGEFFNGIQLIWNDNAFVRAERWDQTGMRPITGRLGDMPALATPAAPDGLTTLLYQSTPNTVTYTDYAKFASFVTEKGHAAVLERHAARQLPAAPIIEAYSRYAKTLIAVGSGQGGDAPRGLEIEIVALTNPYTAPASDPLRFQVLYQGAPLAGNRVTVFAKAADGTVTLTEQDTDAAGTVAFVAAPGTTYLIDAVMLREPARALVAATRGAVWESLWASLTFQAPHER